MNLKTRSSIIVTIFIVLSSFAWGEINLSNALVANWDMERELSGELINNLNITTEGWKQNSTHKTGEFSNYMDGSSTATGNTDTSALFNFGTANVTTACWINIPANGGNVGSTTGTIFQLRVGGPELFGLRIIATTHYLRGNLYESTDYNVDTTYDVRGKGWILVAFTRASTNHTVWVNGESQASGTRAVDNINTNFATFGTHSPPAGGEMIGHIDSCYYWTRALNGTELTSLYSLGLDYPFTPGLPDFVDPSPPDGANNNTQVTFNVTCNSGGVTMWFNGTGFDQTKVIDNATSPAQWTTNVTDEYNYLYWASCTDGTANTSIRTWAYDVTEPIIDLNVGNFYASDNSTILPLTTSQSNYDFNLTDNIDLFAYELNITNSSGNIVYHLLNQSLSGTQERILQFVNFSNLTVGNYTSYITVADSHTANKIKDYEISFKDKEVIYNTAEGNRISIKTHENAFITTWKDKDRYKFRIQWYTEGKQNRRIDIICNNNLFYKENTGYEGHFVCANGVNGNWLDFVGAGVDYEVSYLDTGHYRIDFNDIDDDVTFNSIGGLNVNQKINTFTLINISSSINTDTSTLPPMQGNSLIGSCNISGGSMSYTVDSLWYKNGADQGITANTVTSGNIFIGDSWVYSCRANFTTSVTGYSNSTPVTIAKNNIARFIDNKTGTDINGSTIYITYPSGTRITRITNGTGEVNFTSLLGGTWEEGTYNITFQSAQGFITPISFFREINTSAFPKEYNFTINRATLTINIYDTETDQLITDNVTVSVANLFTVTTTNGTVFIENVSIVSGTYDAIAESTNYFTQLKSFTYTNQEELTVSIYMTNRTSPDIGSLVVNVFDNYYNYIVGANTKLLEYKTSSNSFVEVSQCFTNSNGECIFNVELGTKLYIVTTEKTIDGVAFSAQSTSTGELIKVDNTLIELHLSTAEAFTANELIGLDIVVTNTTLINNVSYLTATFNDVNNLDHTVCIGYYIENGLNEIEQNTTCVTGSAGIVNAAGGYLLDRDYTWVVKVYVLLDSGTKQQYDSYRYDAVEGTFENEWGDYIVKIIILALLLGILALSISMKNMVVFAIGTIALSPLAIVLKPGTIGGVTLSFIIVLDLCILYLSGKKQTLG